MPGYVREKGTSSVSKCHTHTDDSGQGDDVDVERDRNVVKESSAVIG